MRLLAAALIIQMILGLQLSAAENSIMRMSGKCDFSYRSGDSYEYKGDDEFEISDLYLIADADMSEKVAFRMIIDGADLAQESSQASHKYIEEAQVAFKSIADLPFKLVFGKDEMPFGQDYDKMLFDPLVHSLEIDKVWGLNAMYNTNGNLSFEAAVWEEDSITSAVNSAIYENHSFRVKAVPVKQLSAEISYAENYNDEAKYSAGFIFKYKKDVIHAEYSAFKNPNIIFYNSVPVGDDAFLLSYGMDCYLNNSCKLLLRHEYLEDDNRLDSLSGVFCCGLNFEIADKTYLLIEYQRLMGEGSVDDVSDYSMGIKASF